MKKIFFALCVIFVLSTFVVFSLEKQERSHDDKSGNVLGFGLGVLTGFLNHELGHIAMAEYEGKHINMAEWEVSSPVTSVQDRNIALGGFIAEFLSGEILLAVGAKDSPFVLGWLMWDVVNPLGYILVFRTGLDKDPNNDLMEIKNNGNGLKVEWVETALIFHSLISAYRLIKDPAFPVWVQVTAEDFQVKAAFKF